MRFFSTRTRGSRPTALALALIALLAVGLSVASQAPTAADSLEKAEKRALTKAEGELLKLARFAAGGKDYDAARNALTLGIAAFPGSTKLAKEMERVVKKAERGGKISNSFPAKLEKRRTKSHEKVAVLLADAAIAVQESHPDRYQRYVQLVQSQLKSKVALDKLDLVYFEPYFRWVSRSVSEKLAAGEELHEGEWRDAATVAELDREHATWSDPWIVTDGVHEVRTTVSLRKANRILAYVGAYRRYFLARFGGTWDLRAPTGKLPLIVTETQVDLQEQTRKFTGGMMAGPQQIQGAAYYLQTSGKLNPCFVTYEPKDATGMTIKIDEFEQLAMPLVHEVTHQIVFEYSKHDYDARRQIQHQFWAVEAIANYMGYHVWDGETFTLTKPRMIPMGAGFVEGPFAWCQNNKRSLPSLASFRAQSHQQFVTVNNYHIAATLAYFLLEGEGGKYRDRFVTMLEAIHKVRDEPGSWGAAFPDVDEATLEKEWLAFVGAIDLD